MKLSKEQRARREKACGDLSEARNRVNEAVAAYNAQVVELFGELEAAVIQFNTERRAAWETMQAAIEEFNGAVDEAEDEVRGIAEELREQFEGHSDKWKESDAGRGADEFINEYERVDLNRMDDSEPDDVEVEEPDALDEPDEDGSAIGELPDESGG